MLRYFTVLLALFLAACQGPQKETTMENEIDWQGHRGARGLFPENTLPAFAAALKNPKIQTLEMDVVVSKDGQVVVSHEPWMSAMICRLPGGAPIREEEERTHNIFKFTYSEIQQYDCGSKGHPWFPEQEKMSESKPLLSTVLSFAEAEAERLERPAPRYNIEIKSRPEWDSVFTPKPEIFARLVMHTVREAGLTERTCIQSFDPRALEEIHEIAPDQTTAFLVEEVGNPRIQITELSFRPDIYSPNHEGLTAEIVRQAHDLGMQVIPWTINETGRMQALLDMGVDGIITDYPNRIP